MKPLDLSTSAALGGPAWLIASRAAAANAFSNAAMPDPQLEQWRYVDLEFDIADYHLADAPGDARYEAEAGHTAGRALIVDGFIRDIDGFSRLSELSAAPSSPDIDTAADVFAIAHSAFVDDGVVLHLERGQTESDTFLVEVVATRDGTVSFPSFTVVAEQSSESSILVFCRSDDDVDAIVIPRITIDAGPAANVNVTIVQEWGDATRALAQLHTSIERDARVHLGEVGLGGVYSRLFFTVDLEGSGAHSEITGLYFGDEDQTLDYRATINHQAPRTTSNMFLKGAVEGSAHSVFTGMIRIEEEAQQTNAHQTNRNLVLSRDASAESVPNLEILANDVACGHASTVGPLDEEQRYYLTSRGLDRDRADRLQVRGFFEEAIGRLPNQAVAPGIRKIVATKYAEAQAAGRA
ncbi:MAG: Fe-S cluster assembly protein SufD [Acidimicrobiia bacterium]|nr:Fe-S cluster assembly protein SufD [Acidimicrobiia bacterium]